MEYIGLIWFAGYVASMILCILVSSENKKIMTREAIVFTILSIFSWILFIVTGLLFIGTKLFGADDNTVLSTREKNNIMKKRYRWWY
jgi:amino acid transporter